MSSAPWAELTRFPTPTAYPAPGFTGGDGVRALFYDGEPWQGKPTRVFAWYGVPPEAKNGPVPAMVLVHGGGGTAFSDWVRLWLRRGYAALAMDTCGGVPVWSEAPYFSMQWPRHAHSGPNGWGNFADVGKPLRDQWPWHAIGAVLRGHTWLRQQPEVDPARIGLTGISWGGYLTCLLAGIDPRFRFAVPVYGAGFLDLPSVGLSDPAITDPGVTRQWLAAWDPAHVLPQARLPMLWVNGTNDFAFPMNAVQLSYQTAPGPRTLCIRVRMSHAHGGAGENPEEIRVFADALLQGGTPLPTVLEQGRDGRRAWVRFRADSGTKLTAELNWTRALGHWADRTWTSTPARVGDGVAEAELPTGTTVFYFNVFDARNCCVSAEHTELPD